MDGRVLKVGTRGSRLALWQAEWVRARLGAASLIEVIRTSGDRMKDARLQGRSTMGFFTREIERALVEGDIDLAVHSLKDLPVEQPAGLVLAAILPRHLPGDVLLVRPEAHDPGQRFPVVRGARCGAGSLRRQSTLASLRPDLEAVLVRGNVPTRVERTASGVVDAIVLARAGLERLGLDVSPLIAFDLDPEIWIPAPGQAAVAVEVREDDDQARAVAGALDDPPTRTSVELERRLLALAGGGCHAPFAAWVTGSGHGLCARVGAPGEDGSWRLARFEGDAARVEAEARGWFESGSPGRGPRAEEGLCREARWSS